MFSILDNDLYKFTMQQAVLEKYPDSVVRYKFKNRGKHRFNYDFSEKLHDKIYKISKITLTEEEYEYLKTIPFFKRWYVDYLRNYKFNPGEVQAQVTNDSDLELEIRGPWHSTILWEVPLMATISELYFPKIQNWVNFVENTFAKAKNINAKFAEFGTRRRYSYVAQKLVNKCFSNLDNYVGTSNVYFSMINGTKPIGTMAHEWIMGSSALEGLRHANKFAMEKWVDVYNGDLGIALPDTFGTDAFLSDFTLDKAKLFDGVRHDSGSPFTFTNKIVKHYQKLGIDPKTKTIVFSDGISSIDMIKRIKKTCEDYRINYSFGIGTWFTNDFPGVKPLNMVIKLNSVNGIPVVKLSDTEGKVMGNEKAVGVARWTFNVYGE